MLLLTIAVLLASLMINNDKIQLLVSAAALIAIITIFYRNLDLIVCFT